MGPLQLNLRGIQKKIQVSEGLVFVLGAEFQLSW